MNPRNLDKMSKDVLLRELAKLEAAAQRSTEVAGDADRERLVHDLQVQLIQLEMQNRELRDAQLLLEESRDRYTDLYDFGPVGYCTLDAQDCIREINLRGAVLLGAPREELLGRSFLRVARLQDPRPFKEGIRQCREQQRRVTSEIGLLLGKSGIRTLHMVSDPVRDGTSACRIVLLDVSETKLLESRLRLLSESGQVLTASLDYGATLEAVARVAVPTLADLCVVDVLTKEGTERKVVFADPAKQARLAERIRESSPRPGWRNPQARVIETGEPMLLSEVPGQLAYRVGREEWRVDAMRAANVRSLMIVPLAARGRTLGALTLATAESGRRYGASDLDLARNLAIRAALAMDNARLYVEAQRAVAARDAVLAVVSHDLRNLLSIILTSTTVLLSASQTAPGPAGGGRLAKLVEPVHRAGARMSRLIQDLLDVSSIEAGRFSVDRKPERLAALVTEAIGAMRAAAEAKGVHLESELPEEDPVVDCDGGRVEQVLDNLIGNAIKFTQAGGSVTVRVERRAHDVCLSVTDSGPGIPEADLPHVFDRFWKAPKTARMGTGLGLSIAKGIVEAHGGRIWVESRPEGSTFFFALPLAEPDPIGHADAPPAVVARQPGGLVLLAEDDADTREAVSETLERAGYRVMPVGNGAEALAYLRSAELPAVIVLDLRMPETDGWSFLAARNEDPGLRSLPVVVMSGEHGVKGEVIAAGASYVEKPVVGDRLIDAISRAMQ